ncbi:MAG TPA: hypothetical protein VFT87_04110 [Candidatus Saccharimonadales bacterium]|nr:hypothetical protein [Candidatus Saccharimonadales bacterium]
MTKNHGIVELIAQGHDAILRAIGEYRQVVAAQRLEHAVVILQDENPRLGFGCVEVRFLKDECTARTIRDTLRSHEISRHIFSCAITTPSKVVPEWGWTLVITTMGSIADFSVELQIRDVLRGILRLTDF